MKFIINLKDAHEKTGLSGYAVAKQTSVTENTVRKYADQVVESNVMPIAVIILADFYGVDWRNEEIVKVITEALDNKSGNEKTPLRAAS